MSLIVDASVAAKWILDETGSERAHDLLRERLFAPELVFAEVFNAVHKRVRRREATTEMLAETIPFLAGAFEGTSRGETLLNDAAGLAARLGHPIYDCFYVILALNKGIALVTADLKQLDVAKQAGAMARLL